MNLTKKMMNASKIRFNFFIFFWLSLIFLTILFLIINLLGFFDDDLELYINVSKYGHYENYDFFGVTKTRYVFDGYIYEYNYLNMIIVNSVYVISITILLILKVLNKAKYKLQKMVFINNYLLRKQKKEKEERIYLEELAIEENKNKELKDKMVSHKSDANDNDIK